MQGRLVLWKKFSIAMAVGLCAGFGVAAFRTPPFATPARPLRTVAAPLPAVETSQLQLSPPQTERVPLSSPVRDSGSLASAQPEKLLPPATAVRRAASSQASSTNQPKVDEQQLDKLKTRNRRLEALIQVLRQRAQEKKPAPEPSTNIGQ